MTRVTSLRNTLNLWPSTLPEAVALQESLARKVKIIPLRNKPAFVGAADAAFSAGEVFAAATIYTYPALELVEDTVFIEKVKFPYIPGFLTFREGHALCVALRKLKTHPDVILIDGQGIAHPRGIGIASHIGLLMNMPTIGCAKSKLVGEYDEPNRHKGDWTYLRRGNMRVGTVLRTRSCVKPLFVSPGHKIDIVSSIEIVKGCISRYRIPEPLRRVHFLSGKFKREW